VKEATGVSIVACSTVSASGLPTASADKLRKAFRSRDSERVSEAEDLQASFEAQLSRLSSELARQRALHADSVSEAAAATDAARRDAQDARAALRLCEEEAEARTLYVAGARSSRHCVCVAWCIPCSRWYCRGVCALVFVVVRPAVAVIVVVCCSCRR
jgi:hypothetical protein